MIVDCAIYRDGRRVDEPKTPEAVIAAVHDHDGFVWLGLHDPTAAEFAHVMKVFDLHPLAIEDAVHANQRPKLERYGDTMVVVVKPARYVDSDEVIELGQLMIFVGRDFIITVRYGEAGKLKDVREQLEADADRLAGGPGVVLHAIVDRVADDYGEVMFGLEGDIDEIEQQVFSGPRAMHAERIFKLKREVLDFRRAVEPMEAPMGKLASGEGPLADELGPYFRDVHDHVMRVTDRLLAVDALLDSALNANVAQVGMRQNEDMRKISAWVAIVAVPTMIAGIYGMNFEHMPELDWIVGYPVALGTMAIACTALYRNFKRRNWL